MHNGFAGTDFAVMTLGTIVDIDTDVIEYCCRKIHGVVTLNTVGASRQVVSELA